MTTNIENLEVSKTDTEVVIQELNNLIYEQEKLRDNFSISQIPRIKINSFIKELNTEVEWNEQILQELNDSIDFVLNKSK